MGQGKNPPFRLYFGQIQNVKIRIPNPGIETTRDIKTDMEKHSKTKKKALAVKASAVLP